LYFGAHRDEELINLMQSLLVKVALSAPGWTRNALRVEDEGKVILEAWKQARHSILANSFQGPGRRFAVLQCLAAHILIDRLYRIVAGGELLSRSPPPASAVFFSSPA